MNGPAIRRFSAFFIIATLALFSPAVANADAFLAALGGDWSGKGFVRADPRSPEENIRCRLNLVPNGSGNQLFVRGQCSIAGLLLPVNGSIVAEQSTYRADLFRNLVQVSTESFAGRRKGTRLVLLYNGTDLLTKQSIQATMTIQKRKGGFDISMRRTAPGTSRYFDIGTIRFAAR